jgi:HepT-like protein
VDRSVPSTHDWHRELLRQMAVEVPELRPQVISAATAAVDEYLRFRHVVRNVYAFEFEPERIERLAADLRPVLERIEKELLAFAAFLESLAREG